MITPLKTKLLIPGHQSPYYKVGDKTFYTKYHAIKHCREIGHKWPSYHVWEEAGSFDRPKVNFSDAVARQCEIISDTSNKVRLFYSGGKDSNLILHTMLANKSKLDEIAVYRRFPGRKDNTSNEFDQFDILAVTKKTLKQYDSNVKIKFYDVLPEHYSHYSKNLDTLFFPYTDVDFFVHGVHTVAEIYPEILEDGFVNVLGHSMPYVDDSNEFYWLDVDFNMTQIDPFAINFFADPRNKDVAVNMAYAIKDFKSRNGDDMSNYNGNYDNVNKIKNALGFPFTGTVLDDKYDVLPVSTPNWLLTRKQIVMMANAQSTEIGRNTFDKFVEFYENFGKEYGEYFNNGSIYHRWVGAPSEKHKLIDQ